VHHEPQPPLHAGRRAIGAAALLLATALTAPAQDAETCLTCHGDPSMFEGDPRAAELTVDAARWQASIHGQLELQCSDCHQDLAGVEDFPHESALAAASCQDCHPDAVEEWQGSIHGYAFQHLGERAAGERTAPTCASCHGTHDILPADDPASRTHRTRLVETCGGCHGDAGLRTGGLVKLAQVTGAYAESVHGRSVQEGSERAAVCTDCHGVHAVLGKADPNSKIQHGRVAETCGKCHEEEARIWGSSIHGRALKAGIGDSPTCTDCHGEHHILSPKGPDSRTNAHNVADETCGKCHDDPDIIEKFGLQSGVVGSYTDSYHGWAIARDHELAATCVSCHSAHGVLPASDPESTVSEARVVETCGKCHPAADAAFAASYTHETASISANPINHWIRRFYLVLIAVVIGGMALHNALILAWFARRRRRHLAGEAQVVRLSAAERLQHAALGLSFTGLVVTGFALRFPESWWAVELTGLGMSEPARQDLHRSFGLVMIALALVHLVWGLGSRYGREALRAMWPRWTDLSEALQNLRFHAGRGERPRFGRFDYTQKAEYWALVWGTVLMALTGLVLWFPEWAVRLAPSWIVPASQTVHYYEAWLATLAIVVWHLFFVVFHPDVWPLSWTWLDGRMSEREAREQHPRWAAEQLAAGDPKD